jgi:hypothetical protein
MNRPGQDDQFIELISFFRFLDLHGFRSAGILNASTWHNFLDFALAALSYCTGLSKL